MEHLYASRGPVSTMPGSLSDPLGRQCDDHPGVPAQYRVQGETDSMGCEYSFQCASCVTALQGFAKAREEAEAYCDWCSTTKKGCKPHRDFEEGSAGRLYSVCTDCRKRELENLAEELETSRDERAFGWD